MDGTDNPELQMPFARALACPLILLACLVAGCASGGGFSEDEPVDQVSNPYTGLAGQKVATLVWADWRTRTEYSQIQLDLATLVQQKVGEKFMTKGEKDQPPRSTINWVHPGSVIRYQREHPELDALPIAQVAPRLQSPRVIFIEIEDFSAQSPQSILLLKGKAAVTLRVLEVANGQATVAYEERDIQVTYPRNAPEGVPPSDKVNARTIYQGTLTALATRIAARFTSPK